MTCSNPVFCSRHNFILCALPYLNRVGVVINSTDYKFHTDVVDSPHRSIFPAGNIAEVGKNWYDIASTFLVSAKEGLGTSGTLAKPEIANSGQIKPNLQLSTSSGALQQVSEVSLAS